MQKKILESFLERHFQTRKIRFGSKWKRVVSGYDNKIYYIADPEQKAKLKTHIFEIINEIFSFDVAITKKVISRFI